MSGRSHKETLAEQVRAAREARGLSQAALAEAAGLRQATVAEVEGGTNVKADSLARLAVALGVPLVIHPDVPPPEVRPNPRHRSKKK